jgi:hypothetical protein
MGGMNFLSGAKTIMRTRVRRKEREKEQTGRGTHAGGPFASDQRRISRIEKYVPRVVRS